MTPMGVRQSSRCTRRSLRSPGRPPVGRREDRVQFWRAIADGLYPETAVAAARVSWVVGSRWFCQAGGMPPTHLAPSARPLSGRYLSFEEREQLAVFRAQGHGVRECARRLGRAPSTISRELRRNAATRSGGLAYRAGTAQWHADHKHTTLMRREMRFRRRPDLQVQVPAQTSLVRRRLLEPSTGSPPPRERQHTTCVVGNDQCLSATQVPIVLG
jgi:hypothetical protein